MTIQEESFFENLYLRRLRVADALDDPAVRGYNDGLIDKYTDQAHFIYELLQNADDTRARNVRFILEEDRLVPMPQS